MRLTRAARRSLPLVALSLISCETVEPPCVARSGLSRLTILTEPAANGGRATEIDLVFVTDKTLYKSIADMKARDYFGRREQIVRDFPKDLTIRHFELEPTQRQIAYKTEPPCGIVGTLLFVNYDNDKPNRIRFEKAKRGTLLLEPDDFTWRSEQEAAGGAHRRAN